MMATWIVLYLSVIWVHSTGIYCGEYRACAWSTTALGLGTSEGLRCTGQESCKGSPISTDGDVYCAGWKSCMNVKQFDVKGAIFCDSYQSCSDLKADSTKDHLAIDGIWCRGYQSCANPDKLASRPQMTGGYFYCSGERSCENSTIKGADYVYATGHMSAKQAIVRARYEVWLSGRWSGELATIMAPNVLILGYQAAQKASIELPNPTELTVDCEGTWGGWGTDVWCYNGQTCNVICYDDNNCCQGMHVFELPGAHYTGCTANICPTVSHVDVITPEFKQEREKWRKDHVKDNPDMVNGPPNGGGGGGDDDDDFNDGKYPMPNPNIELKSMPHKVPHAYTYIDAPVQWLQVLVGWLMGILSLALCMQSYNVMCKRKQEKY